jgi:hypothetical protein
MYRQTAVTFILFILLSCALSLSCTTSPKEVVVADTDPLDAGVVDGGVAAYFPTRIKQIPLTLTYDPRNNVVCIQFSYQTVTYRQYWDSANRIRFISAVERYHADYEARNLPERKRRKSRRAYDTLKGLSTWGAFKFMINSRSSPRIYLGYTFRDNSPYFLVTQMPAKNELSSKNSEQNSLQIELYFTRAMAEALAEIFDQNYLVSLVPDHLKDRPLQSGAPVNPDDYTQPGDSGPVTPQPGDSPSPGPQPDASGPAAPQPADSPSSGPPPTTEPPAALPVSTN